MATKYESLAKAILLNDGKQQLLPVSKAKLIELANGQKGKFGKDVVDVAGALSYLLGQDETNLTAAKTYTYNSIAALDSSVGDAYVEGNTAQVITKVTQEDGKLKEISSVALDDAHVKTTSFTEEALETLLGAENLPTNLHEALNKIAGKVSEGATNAVTNVVGDEDNTYVNIAVSKTDNNTVTLTVNDSALGNVAKLHYDDLGSAEVASIFNSNPEQS